MEMEESRETLQVKLDNGRDGVPAELRPAIRHYPCPRRQWVRLALQDDIREGEGGDGKKQKDSQEKAKTARTKMERKCRRC